MFLSREKRFRIDLYEDYFDLSIASVEKILELLIFLKDNKEEYYIDEEAFMFYYDKGLTIYNKFADEIVDLEKNSLR